jgi:drug/metabolite transporter (DMT)-like permease
MDSILLSYRGELAALSAALIWAIASVVYTHLGKQITPLVLNMAKSGIAIVLVVLTLLVQGQPPLEANFKTVGLLALSGAIGIGIGDTAFFAALNWIGARRALLLEALAPPLTAILALSLLQERLQWTAWLGIFLTISGVAWVIIERVPDVAVDTRLVLQGLGCGLFAAFTQASGAVMSRAALADTQISPLWSTLIRLGAGVLVLCVWIVTQPQAWPALKPLRSRRLLVILACSAFFSTFLAIWLQQTAIKFTAAGIAQALSATSPLFVVPIAYWSGERVSFRAILGTLIALTGVGLLVQ